MNTEQTNDDKTGILLVNIGTPISTKKKAIRSWLVEFLMDKEVISLPLPLRALLVRGFIQYTRPSRLMEAYRQIWTDDGSPLLVHTRELAQKLELACDMKVTVGMRYGLPSLREGLARMHIAGINKVLVAPLYPQYATATTRTTWNRAQQVAAAEFNMSLTCLPPFYADAGYTGALANSIAEPLAASDALLFSYHGLPVSSLLNNIPGCTKECVNADECYGGAEQPACYRHHATMTSKAVAQQLDLGTKPYFVGFQSRFGMGKWLQPATDKLLAELPERGITKLCVACPSFVADNLETLEEINIRGREIFLRAGGKAFNFVPCLNTNDDWVLALSRLCLLAFQSEQETVAQID